jgi:hypothetical protein
MYVRTLLKVDGSPVPACHDGGRNIAAGDDDCYSDWHFLALRTESRRVMAGTYRHYLHGDVYVHWRGGGYRAGSHIAVNMLTDRLPDTLKILCARLVDLLMLLISHHVLVQLLAVR